MTLFAQL